jgi:hypothetical protein
MTSEEYKETQAGDYVLVNETHVAQRLYGKTVLVVEKNEPCGFIIDGGEGEHYRSLTTYRGSVDRIKQPVANVSMHRKKFFLDGIE